MDMKNNVRTQGLTESEVAQSRQQHGENVLTPPKRKSLLRLYLEKYDDPIIRILLVAAAISLCLAFVNGEYIETIGIILAIFFATTVGFYFERDAARKFSMLTALGEEQRVKVVRNGKVVEIARREVVVGDVVLIETGDEVPADAEPIQLMLNRVVSGWTEGLQLIGEGGKIDLYLPSELGYGEQGNQAIGPNSVLTFNVELTKVGKYVAPAPVTEQPKGKK